MPTPHQPSGLIRGHLLPAVETAVASLVLGAGGPAFAGACLPTAARTTRCGVTASASVADPRATTDVLAYVRSRLGGGPWQAPPPILVEVSVDRRFVTVNFLRN